MKRYYCYAKYLARGGMKSSLSSNREARRNKKHEGLGRKKMLAVSIDCYWMHHWGQDEVPLLHAK